MGTIKDRNGMDLTEAEDIKKRWQEYTEELYKKDLHDPDNHDGEITHCWEPRQALLTKWRHGSSTFSSFQRDGLGMKELGLVILTYFFPLLG